MKNETPNTSLNRRDAIKQALKATLTAAVAVPVVTQAASPVPLQPTVETEFVPENDYPFFGGQLPEDY